MPTNPSVATHEFVSAILSCLLFTGCLAENAAPANSFQLTGEAPKGELIPLAKIWSNEMPGTRLFNLNMNRRDSKSEQIGYPSNQCHKDYVFEVEEGKLAAEILFVLPEKKGRAFIVRGLGLDALRNAHSVLVHAQPNDPHQFADSDELSVVFFTQHTGSAVELTAAYKSKETIHLQYRFWQHPKRFMKPYLAIVPLNKLGVGTYRVELENTHKVDSTGMSGPDIDLAKKIVCSPSVFSIKSLDD